MASGALAHFLVWGAHCTIAMPGWGPEYENKMASKMALKPKVEFRLSTFIDV